MKKAKAALLSLLLLVIALSAAASMSGLRPGLFGDAAVDSGTAPAGPVVPLSGAAMPSVEPLSILALGGGLVFLGIYAKLKRAK